MLEACWTPRAQASVHLPTSTTHVYLKHPLPNVIQQRLLSVTLLTALMDLEFLNPHVPLSLSFSRSRRSLLAGSLRRRGRLPPQPRAGLTVLDARTGCAPGPPGITGTLGAERPAPVLS